MFQGAKLSNANLKGANLQRAYLRQVNLRDTVCEANHYMGCKFIYREMILFADGYVLCLEPLPYVLGSFSLFYSLFIFFLSVWKVQNLMVPTCLEQSDEN